MLPVKWNPSTKSMSVSKRSGVCINPAGFKPTGYFFAHFQNKKYCRITKNLLQ